MRGRWIARALLALAAGGAAGVQTGSATPPGMLRALAGPTHGLATAVADPVTFLGQDASTAFAHVKAAGATYARVTVSWPDVAPTPDASAAPDGFVATDPGDPHYNWAAVDRAVTSAVANGLAPILDIAASPVWAQAPHASGPKSYFWEPNPSQLAAFAGAAANRYDGSFDGLPRVRYWQIWNEPNLQIYLQPQFVGKKPVSPSWYRAALNATATAIHAVHDDNVVVGGMLAPYGNETGTVGNASAVQGVAPLLFMRQVLCIGRTGKPTCRAHVSFDAWAVQPYTWGGPTHRALAPDDVALGNLPQVQSLLTAATSAGHVVTGLGRPLFWVSEWSWDTAPPDPKAVPIRLQARWVSEALYRMWQNGVSLATWYLVRDQPFPAQILQSGLYFRGSSVASDRAKPTFTAFRFPFVAILRDGGYDLWGRTPTSSSGHVVVERRTGTGWETVGRLTAGPNGIFRGRWTTGLRVGYVRAVAGTTTSLPFALRPVPDRPVSPFGM